MVVAFFGEAEGVANEMIMETFSGDDDATLDTGEILENINKSKKTEAEEGHQPVLRKYQARYDWIFWIVVLLALYACVPTYFAAFFNDVIHLSYNGTQEIECNWTTVESNNSSLPSLSEQLSENIWPAIFGALILALPVLLLVKYLPEAILCAIALTRAAASLALAHEFVANAIHHKDLLDRGEIGRVFANRGYFLYFMLFFVDKFGVTSIVQYFQCFRAKGRVIPTMFSDPLCILSMIVCAYNMSFWKVVRLTHSSFDTVDARYSYFALLYCLLVLNLVANFGDALLAKLVGVYHRPSARSKSRRIAYALLDTVSSCDLRCIAENATGVLPLFHTLVLACTSRRVIMSERRQRNAFSDLFHQIYVIFNAPRYAYALASIKGYGYAYATKLSIVLLKKNSSSPLALTQGLDATLQLGFSIYTLAVVAMPTYKYGFNNLPPPECLDVDDFRIPLAVDVITFFTLYFYINIGMVASNTVYATVACRFENRDDNDSVGKTIFEGVMRRKGLVNVDSTDL